jgi:hypothetical protein
MRKIFFIIVLIFVTPVTLVGSSSHARVGVCERDITPISPGLASAYEAAFGTAASVNHTDPVFLAGFGNNRQATGYNDRLWARGLVVDGRGGGVAIVALDLVGYFNHETQTIRALVDPASEIDYMVVHSTHQHEGPDTMGIWGPDALTSGTDMAYLDYVNLSVADCIDEAASNLTPARLKFATTDSVGLSLGLDVEDDGFGVSDGKVLVDDDLLAPATDGRIVNSRLSIMQATSLGPPTEVLATLVNFASHPESLGSNNTLVTSDFPHYAREAIEASQGGTAIWVSGDLGVLQGPLDIDVLDPDTGSPAVRRTFRWAQVHGEQLAARVVSAIPPHPGKPTARIDFASTQSFAIRLDNPYFRFFIAIGVLPTGLFTDDLPDVSIGFPFPPPFDTIPQPDARRQAHFHHWAWQRRTRRSTSERQVGRLLPCLCAVHSCRRPPTLPTVSEHRLQYGLSDQRGRGNGSGDFRCA